jgi:glycogen debranching enzyme-like protein
MARDTISILDGSTFIVSDLRGDIEASPDQPLGFFFRDTRFLDLEVDGQRPRTRCPVDR